MGNSTDNSCIAVAAHYEDNPPREVSVSEWSHPNLCPRNFSIIETLRNGIIARGTFDNHLAATPRPTPGVLVLFGRQLATRERLRHWWAEQIYCPSRKRDGFAPVKGSLLFRAVCRCSDLSTNSRGGRQ